MGPDYLTTPSPRSSPRSRPRSRSRSRSQRPAGNSTHDTHTPFRLRRGFGQCATACRSEPHGVVGSVRVGGVCLAVWGVVLAHLAAVARPQGVEGAGAVGATVGMRPEQVTQALHEGCREAFAA